MTDRCPESHAIMRRGVSHRPFSLYANKTITTGDGGMILTPDSDLAAVLREKRCLGFGADVVSHFTHHAVDFRYPMTAMQAAVGSAQLRYLAKAIDCRRRVGRWYEERLDSIPGIELRRASDWAFEVPFMYPVLLDTARGVLPVSVARSLASDGIETRRFFAPLCTQPVVRQLPEASVCRRAAELHERGLCLPLYPGMEEAHVDQVVCALQAEYRYNGLGHRIAEHIDMDDDQDVDGDDEWRHIVNDERWREVAVYLGSDTTPTEEYLHHRGGVSGEEGGSYVDALVHRKEYDGGSLDEIIWLVQNQHQDVTAWVSDSGAQLEMARYSAYGVPFGLPAGDADSDGDNDDADLAIIAEWESSGPYDVRGDIDIDGAVDASDRSAAAGTPPHDSSSGWGVLAAFSSTRTGFTGGDHHTWNHSAVHRRNRLLLADLGLWNRRDPFGYVDGMHLYAITSNRPLFFVDPFGREGQLPTGATGTGDDGGFGDAILRFARTLNCCEERRAHNWRNGGQQYAEVICCYGEPVVCVWWPAPPSNLNPPTGLSPAYVACIRQCMRAHEEEHIKTPWKPFNCQAGKVYAPGISRHHNPWMAAFHDMHHAIIHSEERLCKARCMGQHCQTQACSDHALRLIGDADFIIGHYRDLGSWHFWDNLRQLGEDIWN